LGPMLQTGPCPYVTFDVTTDDVKYFIQMT